MKNRRNRWTLIAIVAIALGTALMSLPSLAPLSFSEAVASSASVNNTLVNSAPPVGTSWQVTLMSNRW